LSSQPQREWFEKDYYKALGVSETASAKEITRAYRKLAKQHHPDSNPGSEERFKEISSAYDVLGDAEKRKAYDEVRRLGPMGGFGGGDGSFSFSTDDLGDLFGGLFGNAGGGPRGGRRRGGAAGPARGADLEAELRLNFLDAAQGATATVHVTSDAPCETCHGSGAAPGTRPKTCTRCGGRGVLDENQGFFSFSTPCRQCGGRGSVIETPCPTCRGGGVVRKARQVKVRVPAGVDDGQRIRLKGRGGAGRNGGPAGNLDVIVHVDQHELFGRRGRDLTITVPITFAEAALGAEVSVPTLGDPVTVKVPAGTKSGRTLRVKGRGVVPQNGAAGDLLVTVEVAVPQKLTAAERKAIEALAAATDASPRAHLGV
jgi:molecular chaperone DnaJ